jgi:hypothetical protein
MKTLRKSVNPSEHNPRMKYPVYAMLRDMLEREKQRAHEEFCLASGMTFEQTYDGISPPKYKRGDKYLPGEVIDFMWQNYRRWAKFYDDAMEQLYHAAQESNRTHPNPGMREFWGIQ